MPVRSQNSSLGAIGRKKNSEGARPSWLQRAPRLALIGWAILLVMGLYLIRLWQLQFLEGGSWSIQAEQQQVKLITISPSRGVIFDRHGEIMVRNIPAYNVTIAPGLLPDDDERERAVLQRLSQMIDVPYSTTQDVDAAPYQGELGSVGRQQFPPYGEPPMPGLLEMVNEVRYLEPYTPIVVNQNIERDLALMIAQEGSVTMPGVGIQIIPRRNYTSGPLTSQILGFLGPIPPEDVEEYKAKGYDSSIDRIGYDGIEYQLEESLRGTPGRRIVEKDVQGQELSTLSETPPHPGDNVHLTLDLELQEVAEEALRAGMAEAGSERGVFIALDPRDGQILSLVSLPTYDNNLFSKRIDMEKLRELEENPHFPFLNHAIADQMPPGSIFKMVPAAAALQEGVVNRYTTINCPGIMWLPNKFAPDNPELAQPFYCWIHLQMDIGHGPVDVVEALKHSCDIYFYQVGGGYPETDFEGLGIARLAAYAEQFGLGQYTGIELPGEIAGRVPTPQWKRANYQETWTTGDTYNTSIGQGFLVATPIQMANVMAAVANSGVIYRPQVIHHIADADGNLIREFEPEVLHRMEVDAPFWAIVQEGVDLAVSEDGTGRRAELTELGINVAGKTGTAEYCDDIAFKAGRCDVEEHETLPTHAWFMAYAPVEAPELVALAWVYDGGEGSVTAAPVAQEVMDYYFRRKLGRLDELEEEEPGAEPGTAEIIGPEEIEENEPLPVEPTP